MIAKRKEKKTGNNGRDEMVVEALQKAKGDGRWEMGEMGEMRWWWRLCKKDRE